MDRYDVLDALNDIKEWLELEAYEYGFSCKKSDIEYVKKLEKCSQNVTEIQDILLEHERTLE